MIMNGYPRSFGVVAAAMLLFASCTDHEAAALKAENAKLRQEVTSLRAELEQIKGGAQNLLNEAQVAANAKRYPEAEAALENLLHRHPTSEQAASAKRLLAEVRLGAAAVRDEEERTRKAEEARLAAERRREEQRRALAARSMAKRIDKLEGITWYQDRSTHSFESAVFLYFAERNGYVTNLRLKLRYYDDDWLFIESFTVYADGQRFEYPAATFERDHGSGSIWEWYDEPVTSRDLTMIRAVIAAKDASVRYHGRQYRSDRRLGSSQKAALQRVLDAYQALSGTLP